MPHIQVLPKHIADMIAAGEVVERPASVAKELVENAIDAGADQVTVELRQGGVGYLRVADNGVGIPKEEVATAFLRHATSKVRSAKDLDAIGTLGFRGEALAAIAAVSRVQIVTKPREQEMGWSHSVEAGEDRESGPAGCPDGTAVVVRDLFFSVPARYKFLKTDVAEASAVQAVVERQALGHPEVSFRFIREGKSLFTTPGDGDPVHALRAVLPDDGPELLRGESGDELMSVTAFVSPPSRCRGSRTCQHFFVNGRWIRSKLLTAAVENAYRNQRMVGKFPAAVVWISLRLDKVDVNSHPTKTEVRFVDERQVFGGVYRAALAALEGNQDRPKLETVPLEDISARGRSDAAVFASPAAPAAVKAVQAPAAPVRVPAAEPGPREVPGAASGPAPSREAEPVQTRMEMPPAAVAAPAPVPSPAPDSSPAEEAGETPVSKAPVQEPAAPAEEVPWRVVGEVLRTYIIVERGEEILFIDKHAAHERMGFDALKAQGYRPMAQELLSPLSWRGSAEDRAALLDHAGELGEFGFQIEDFGNGCLLVSAAPDFLTTEDIPAQLEELAGQYRATGGADPDAQRDALMHSMACKAAMKGGQRNQVQELQAVAQAVMEGRVTHCPHGRPVATVVTRRELEKQFGRA